MQTKWLDAQCTEHAAGGRRHAAQRATNRAGGIGQD